MPGMPYPFVKPQFFDSNGDPLSGYQLFCYASGTTTKQNTYSDADLVTPNANPIILDSAGRASIFLSANTYKFVMAPPTDTDPPVAPIWTMDGVAASAAFNVNVDIPATAGENIGFAEICYMADGSVGGTVAGRWYRANATTAGSGVSAPVLGFPTANIASAATGTIRISGRVPNLGALATGSRYYVSTSAGQLTTTKLANMRFVGHADSTASLILEPQALTWRELILEFGSPGAGALTSGVKKYIQLPFASLVTGWSLFAEQAGSIVIDVWSDTYANFPPTVADTIAGSEKPTLVAVQKNQDLNLSTWTNLIPAGNVLGFNIDSITTVNYVSLTLELLTV